MAPHQILSLEKNLKLIEKKCAREFSDENDQDECYLWVLESLQADACKRLEKFQGKNNSSVSTFLSAVVNNLIIDFRRKKYGRRRYPELIKKLGRCAKAVYKYVCWQNYTYADAFDFLQVDKLYTGTYEDFAFEAELISTASCKRNPKFIYMGNETEPLRQRVSEDLNPLDDLIEHIEQSGRSKAVTIIQKQLSGLEDHDKLLIRLVYGSDRSVAHGARVLGIKPALARKNLKQILLGLKEKLLEQGIRSM